MQTAASSSSHILDVRKPSHNLLWAIPPRPEVSITHLSNAIQNDAPRAEPQTDLQDDESDVEIVEIPPIKAGRGSKRVAGRRTASGRRPAKRARVVKDTSEPEHELRTFLALEHVFEISLSKGNSYTDDQARGFGWLKEETDFEKVVSEHLEIGEQIERRVWLHSYRGANGVYVVDGPSPNANQLFIAPKLMQDSFDPGDYDLPARSADVLAAAVELEQNGRVQLETHLRVVPPGTVAESNSSARARPDFPFAFLLHIKLFLKSPSIFRPITDLTDMTNETQRRLLLYIFQDHLEFPVDFDIDLPHFYGCLKSAPCTSAQLQMQVQPDGLESKLLPFQRNSVLWMLQHEGKSISPEDGKVVPLSEGQKPSPMFWVSIPPLGGSSKGKEKERDDWWFNVITGELLPTRPPHDEVLGGLLAEEPGLGKTVESIALVLYNTPHPSTLPPSAWDDAAELEVSPIKGTLIVTPATLCKQWADELKTHAPHLRVLQYEGWTSPAVKKVLSRSTSQAKPPTKSKRNTKKKSQNTSTSTDEDEIDLDTADWRAFAGHFDVVLTTYNVLMKELNVARVPIKRPRREIAVYQASDERFRSPLVMVEWQRVLMDEVQQVGGGKAAEMVSLIPRRASWAVSGTPAKAHVQDLVAPLRFMRIHPLLVDAPQAVSNKLWNRLLKPGSWSAFTGIFDRYAVRTPKREAEGLDIPKQTRFVVPISLGMIERHFYDQTLETALLELGLDARGVARWDDWELNGALLRSAIRKLRMACIHPQVGALGAQAAGGQRALGGGVIRPIGDVLIGMVDANWQAWMTDKKNLITARIHRSLLEQKGPGSAKQKKALEAFLPLRQDALNLIEELRDTLAKHDEKGKQLIKEANVRAGGEDTPIGTSQMDEDQQGAANGGPKGKGKATSSESDGDSSPNPELLPASAEGDEHRHARQGLLARMREAQVVLHRIEFSLGDLYHQLGKAKEEEESYGNAEALRRSLLKTTEDSANRAIARLTQEVIRAGVSSKQLLLLHAAKPGIKTENLFFEANQIMDVLDLQRKLIFEWRGKICKLLTQKIVSEGESADGNEYQRALDVQGEVEAYLVAYGALLADRREVLNQERTALAAHDDRERRLRHTKAAARAAAAFDHGVDLENVVDVDNGEDQELAKLLKQQRQECKEDLPANRALRSVMIDLGKVIGGDMEQQIAKDEAKRLRRILQEQTGLVDRMLNEMTPLRAAFNGRIAYFRQLQELSDSVAEIVLEDQTIQEALEENEEQIRRLEDSVRTKGARQRFLQYIAQKSEDMGEEDKECGICNCDFETGYLLVCGHIYCDECLQLWRKKHYGAAFPCPNCRAENQGGETHRITFGRSTEEQVEHLRKEEADLKSGTGLKAIKYNTISSETLEALTKVESFGHPGRYGAKIQTLVRHLLLIEETDPGAKSIVFSAWADSLHIIEHALAANGIGCIRIDANAGKRTAAHQFQTNAGIRVLLLHGERENSGLNLTCAKRIMLVEPTVNISFEIQAIARVDRLGQKEETEVYCYYAIDTVEQNILDIAARKGTSLYTTSNATTAVDLAAAAVIEQQKVEAPTKDKKLLKGDFIAGAEQMLEVLFPDLFVDIADIVMEDVVQEPTLTSQRSPVAGPIVCLYVCQAESGENGVSGIARNEYTLQPQPQNSHQKFARITTGNHSEVAGSMTSCDPDDAQRRAGGYGIVQKAELYESAYLPTYLARHLNGPPQIVAVKQIRISAADDPFETKRAFTKELLVWSSLEKHKGIAKFIGFYADFERAEAWLLSPWEPHGNIMDFGKRRQLEVPEKLSIIHDTIDALTFLHQRSPPICHGDVKSPNVLVNANCRAVLCDFGLARIFEDSGFGRLEMSTGFKGSIRWCSPELLDGGPRSPSSDVYAWAWLVWEIMTGEMPYQDTFADYAIIRKIFESPSPQVDGASRLSDCLQLWELITRCWSVLPEQRPTSGMCRTTVTSLPRCAPSPAIPHAASPSPELLENLGDLERWKGNYEENAAYMKKALAVYEQRGDPKGIASVLRKQAAVAYNLDEFVKAMEFASTALEKLRALGDDVATADALYWLGCSLEMQHMEDKATPRFNEALEIFRIHGDDVGVVRCLERLGEIHRRRNQLSEALKYLEDAIAIASQNGDRLGETKAAKSLGYVAWSSGDTAKAIATFTNVVETARHLGLGSVACEGLDCLASIRFEEGRYEEAEHLFQEAISVARTTNQDFTLAKSLAGMGDIERERDGFAVAEGYLKESCALFQKISYQGVERVWSISRLAQVKEAQGDKEAALSGYEKAIFESRRLNAKLELSEGLTEKGLLLQEAQNYEEAALCLEASLVLDQELESPEDVRLDIARLATIPKTAVQMLEKTEGTCDSPRAV